VAACACDTLCHVPRRRPAASLPRYQPVPAEERTQATRGNIIAAAIHAFRVRGYSATTMSTVAALAKVSPRTLYRYFGSKSELFAATVANATEDFLRQLSFEVHHSPLRTAILTAFEHADIELNDESREMMRMASSDQRVWQHFLGATIAMESALADTLQAAASDEARTEDFAWEVRASALLAAIATAYRHWASLPGSQLSEFVATAVDVVLPTINAPRGRDGDNASPIDPLSRLTDE